MTIDGIQQDILQRDCHLTTEQIAALRTDERLQDELAPLLEEYREMAGVLERTAVAERPAEPALQQLSQIAARAKAEADSLPRYFEEEREFLQAQGEASRLADQERAVQGTALARDEAEHRFEQVCEDINRRMKGMGR